MTPSEQLRVLHERYCALTGLEMKWQPMAMEHMWFDWWREGYTEEDLEITIKYLSRLYCKRPDILAACLRLKRLIGDTLFFNQMKSEARKIVRVREENSDKESVMRSTGRTSQVDTPSESAGQILQREALVKALQEFKKTL